MAWLAAAGPNIAMFGPVLSSLAFISLDHRMLQVPRLFQVQLRFHSAIKSSDFRARTVHPLSPANRLRSKIDVRGGWRVTKTFQLTQPVVLDSAATGMWKLLCTT